MRTTKLANVIVASVLASTLGLGIAAAADVIVGTGTMTPTKNIFDNAGNSKDHTVLVAAVRQAELKDALMGVGPYTVFAPVNSAFTALPEGAFEELIKNKLQLGNVLKYHVVSGTYTFDELEKLIKAGGGETKLATLAGRMLTVRKNGTRNISVKDETGAVANIAIYDVMQSNGVIHVVDRVLMMKKQ